MERRLGPRIALTFAALVALAALPVAAQEGDGTVTAASPVLFEGATRVVVREGVVVVEGPAASAATLLLQGDHALVRHTKVSYACRMVDFVVEEHCVPVYDGRPSEQVDEVEVEDLALTAQPNSVSRLSLAWATEEGRLDAALSGLSKLAVDGDDHACHDPGSCWSWMHDGSWGDAEEGDWFVEGDAWRLSGDGLLRLRLFGVDASVTGLVDGEPFSQVYSTGERNESVEAAPGQEAYRVHRVEVLDVEVEATLLEATAEVPGRAYGDLTAFAFGSTSFYDASGRLERDGEQVELRDEDATFTGNLTVRPVMVLEDDGSDDAARLVLQVRGDAPPVEAAAPFEAFPGGAAGVAVGLGGAALAAATLAYFWPYLKFLATGLVVPMYTRIGREDVLEHKKREEIFAMIRDTPGIHAHEISTRAAVGWGTTVYHLKLLENHGLVVGKRTGRYKRFFAAAGGAARQVDTYAVLRNDTTSAIAKHVLAHPGCIQKDVCAALGLQPSLVTWHMNRLEEVDLVKKVRDGRMVRYYAGGGWNGLHMDFGPATTVTPALVDAGAN